MPQEIIIDTDVLVIGGGMAGIFAAVKAKEQGLDVTLTDKACVGKAGSTHFSEGDILFFRPERGHKIEEWMNILNEKNEYINNREWDEICLRESKDRYEDLVSWGVPFYGKDGVNYVFSGTVFSGAGVKQGVYEDVTMRNRQYSPIMRKKNLQIGVRILDNIMVSELLQQDGKVVGAVGFHIRSGNLCIFRAGATVIATGSSSLKSGTYPVLFWTGDGEAMAYRAGATLISKEFAYGMHYYRADVEQLKKKYTGNQVPGEIINSSYQYPFAIGGGFSGWYNRPNLTSEGTPVVFPAWEAHCGRAPLYIDLDSNSSGQWEWLREFLKRMGTDQPDKIGLDILRGGKIKWPASRVMTNSIFGGSGIFPVDTDCSSGIPGLYAAGNSCGTMASGSMYAGMGFASNHAAVTGARAGQAAARYASKNKVSNIAAEEITRKKGLVCAPLERKGGFSPNWVTQMIQSITVPYFYLGVKHETRLKAALTIAEFINNHLVPLLKAQDIHEWRLAQETRNLALITEMRLRSSLFRTESRGNHFREDFPYRDDPNWLAWVKIVDASNEMRLIKSPIPQQWWPDLSKTYEDRYPRILPLEELRQDKTQPVQTQK
jgi:succinate dehydrogenase/fumarate reductase flavoprotein subunit